MDKGLGEFEPQLLSIPSIVRIELVLVHTTRHCPSGLTRRWLQLRPWVDQHHHIVLHSKVSKSSNRSNNRKSLWKVPETNWNTLATQLKTEGFQKTLHNRLNEDDDVDSADHGAQDVARLARRVLGTSVGLVLGGGGAKGIAHIGVIEGLIQEGVPIDAVGGTSIGALVGGLYARDQNLDTMGALLRVFSSNMSSKWRMAYDLTYPFCAWFTGETFNRALWKIFEERLIEDMWIPFFCVTTDISTAKTCVHKSSLAWRYIRASMSLSGFLPPLWEEGNSLLLDGGYTNNLPVDLMMTEFPHISRVIAVDVGAEREQPDEYYQDHISGTWLALKRFLGRRVAVPSLADIQTRLANVTCLKQIELVRQLAKDSSSGIHYLRPPINAFQTLEFEKFDQIKRVGEAYAAQVMAVWRQDGTLESFGKVVAKEQTDSVFGGKRPGTPRRRRSF